MREHADLPAMMGFARKHVAETAVHSSRRLTFTVTRKSI